MRGHRARGETLSQMNRRVDFSLGMSNAATQDMSGDVYEDRDPQRLRRELVEASRERSRSSQERVRASIDTGRSTAMDPTPGNLARRATDSRWRSSASLHRNRFFGRGGQPEQDMMEKGQLHMQNIPEEQARSGQNSGNRIDPRSGLVSPAAYRMTTDERPAGPPQLPSQVSGSGALGVSSTDAPRSPAMLGRSQTEDFGSRR